LLLNKNKKAISEIVGYTILIVIAVSLSILVYSFLRLYIPKEQVTCDEDVRLIIQDYTCKGGKLNLTITNKGLFKAGAFYLWFSNDSQKEQINKNNFLLYNKSNSPDLKPGESFDSIYDISSFVSGTQDYELELQPAIIVEKKIIVCENAIITQDITCTS